MTGAYVLLEDGTRFDGLAVGAETEAVGEIVFTTGMSGYQESTTDPSFAGQLITFTYPHIGNYGVSARAMESPRAWARAVIMRAAVDRDDCSTAEQGWLSWLREQNVAAITGVDTRSLVRHIRDRGAMRGGIFNAATDRATAAARIASEPPMAGQNLARLVATRETVTHRPRGGDGGGALVRIAAIDCGIKRSIIDELTGRGAEVTLYPFDVSPQTLLASSADAFFLANGPGDPATLATVVATVRALIGKRPIWGICLGHQLLCQAVGLKTFKLPFGHRGANHPVRDLRSGRIEITSQNHGFAVLGPNGERTLDASRPVRWNTEVGEAQLTHINLYDKTVEGLELLDLPGATVQYHPEAGPGPNDALHQFDRFLEKVRNNG